MRKNHIFVIAAIAIGAVSCTSLSPEERAKMEETVSEQYQNLGGVYVHANQLIADIHDGKIQMEFGCDASTDSKADPKSLNVFHIAELKKFTADNAEAFEEMQEEWMDSEWKWLSTSRYSLDDNMHSWPSEFSDKELDDVEYVISSASWGSIFFDTEFAVIVPDPRDSIENVMPELLDDERFASGYFNGWAIIYSRDDFQPVCVHPFVVESSEELAYKDYGGRRGGLINALSGSGDPKKALRNDYKDRFRATLDVVLKGYETRGYGGF